MINKNKFSIRNTKKVLHKVGKQWVVVSTVLLGLATGGAVSAHVTHADVNTEPTQVAQNSEGAKHAYHLPQANRSQTSSLQTQAITSTVDHVSSLKTKAMATWDNAWDQKVQGTIDQTADMSAKMDSLSHFSSYVASDEQPLINSYGMTDVYGHMPDNQSNADYNNYAEASNAIVSDATSLANRMITNVEHSMKVSNHARQMANDPIHKQHAHVHAKEVSAASVSVKSANDQVKHDSAWAVRNGANDPAKHRDEAKASASMAHTAHMAYRAHAHKIASHTAMLKHKASNAMIRKSHAEKRSVAQSQSVLDQANHDTAWSLRNRVNDPARLAHSNHAKSVSASQALADKRAAQSADQNIASFYQSHEAKLNLSRAASAASSADTSISNSYSASVSANIKAKDSVIRSNAIAASDRKIHDSYVNSVSDSVSTANDKKVSAATSVADQSLEHSIAKSYSQSADQSLDDSIATSYATSADDSIATSMNAIRSASVSNSVTQSASASTAKAMARSAANVKSNAKADVAAGVYDPNKLSEYKLGELGTIGYCYDTQGNEYMAPNILRHNYQMSGNEIFVKIANTNVTVDTGVYC